MTAPQKKKSDPVLIFSFVFLVLLLIWIPLTPVFILFVSPGDSTFPEYRRSEIITVSLPLLCPDAPDEGLSSTRTITTDFHNGEMYLSHPIVYDSYTLKNNTQQDMTLTLYYPRFCENYLLDNTVIDVDGVTQPEAIYTSGNGNYQRDFLEHSSVNDLRNQLAEGDLDLALTENSAPSLLSSEYDPLCIWYYEVKAVVPAGSEIIVTAQWRDSTPSWMGGNRNHYFAFLYRAADSLPCADQSLALWNYEKINLIKQSLDLNLKKELNTDQFESDIGSEYILFERVYV